MVYKWYILPIWIWNHASLDLMILSTSFFVKASDLSSAVKPTSTGVISNNVNPYFFQWSSTGMVFYKAIDNNILGIGRCVFFEFVLFCLIDDLNKVFPYCTCNYIFFWKGHVNELEADPDLAYNSPRQTKGSWGRLIHQVFSDTPKIAESFELFVPFLGCGFKYFLFSSLSGEDSHFD